MKTSPPSSSRSSMWKNLIIVAAVLGLVGIPVLSLFVEIPGFGPQELEDTQRDPIIVSDATGSADLKQGLDFLNRLEEFDARQIQPKVINHLQQWLNKQPDPEQWQPDPIAQQMQQSFSAMAAPERLSSKEFEPYDLFVLQEATWLRDLTQAIAGHSHVDPVVAGILDSVPGNRDLQMATRLFDWTVRNLQTDRPVKAGDTHRLNSNVILHAWESMLMGRGTMAEKSRVFILLARQLRIPVVMLAILPSPEAKPEPWLPAVFSDGQLYLFDMQLGTPVLLKSDSAADATPTGIATWRDVQADPALLESLGDADFPYRVTAEDLPNVVALIDATPGYLSKRLRAFEGALTGADKMVLSVAPTLLAQEIDANSGIERVGIWDLAYSAFSIRSQMTPQSAGFLALLSEHNLLDMTPLKIARVLHFRGQFEPTDEQSGALNLYLDSRTSEQQMRELQRNRPSEAALAAEMDEEVAKNRAAHAARLASLEIIMRRTKENATYWLGLMKFDQGQYQVSIDYLRNRLLKTTPDTIWRDGAHYNLGRALEAKAIASDDESLLQQARDSYEQVTMGPVSDACRWRLSQLAAPIPDESTE